MEEENNNMSINTNIKTYKSHTEPKFESKKHLYNSNSMTDLNNAKTVKVNSSKSKNKRHYPRSTSEKVFDHYDKKNCEHCKGIDNLMENDKSKLSSFIQNNSQFLNLFGNKRYNRSSPYLFVEDHKCGYDDERIGLIPIPSKPRIIMKSPDENHNLYEIQRKIVMIRRFQYGKRNLTDPNLINSPYYNEYDLPKIILIQKMFRGFIVRKKVEYIMNFKDVIERWQNLLDKLRKRRFIINLFNYQAKLVPKDGDIKGYNYISKIRKNKQKNIDIYNNNFIYKNKNHKNEENKINNDSSDDIFKNIKDIKKYSKKIIPKERVKSSSSLLTKDYYDIKDTKEKIDKIENNYKNHLDSKKNIFKKEEDDGKNNPKGLFIDKIYFSQTAQKVINFNNIMRKALQKAAFRKKPNMKKIELKEEISNRIDFHPDNKKNYVIKCKLKTTQNEEPKIFSFKDLNFKNQGFYIDIVRMRNKKVDDKKMEPLVFSISKNIDFTYKREKNENLEKNQIENDNILTQQLIIPKDKYCYMTKEYKINKQKNIIDEDNPKIKSTKNLIIDSKERFSYEGGAKDEKLKEKNENNIIEDKKFQNIDIDNKQEIIYIGKEKPKNENKYDINIDNKQEIKYIGKEKPKKDDINNIDIDNKQEIKYIGKEKPKSDIKNKDFIIENNSNFNFLKIRIQHKDIIPKKILSKSENFYVNYIGNASNSKNENNYKLSHEKINDFFFEGKERQILEKNKDFLEESLPNINYIGKTTDSKKEDKFTATENLDLNQENKNKKDLNSILVIEKNNIINYPKVIKNINNNFKMEKKENFLYEGNDKDMKTIEKNNLLSNKIVDINFQGVDEKPLTEESTHLFGKDKLINEKNIDLNILKPMKKDEIRQFNKEDIIILSNESLNYKGKPSEVLKAKKDIVPDEDIENKMISNLYLIHKLNRKRCYISKICIKKVPNEIKNESTKDDYLFKRKDISINDNINNGILITKSRYIKNSLKEKIYKKPLFNEFYSYFVEQSLIEDESPKLKAKPKKKILDKKDSKDNMEPIEESKNYNSEQNSPSNKTISDKNEPAKEDKDSELIKRIIPGKGSSETFRIKPNHLLKVIKVAKDKPTYEQYIHVGKIVPKKIKEEDEEFIYIRYKSKTPSKSQKKYIRNNLLKNINDEDIKKYLPKWKEDGINLKAKPKLEDIESDSEDNKVNKKVKLIKVFKFNIKNYCYASKIRKKNEEIDSKIQLIKDKYKSFKKEEKQKEDKVIQKEELRQNIINNNCFCDKDIIKKNTYNDYLNYYNNLNKKEIIQIPISYKTKNNIPNYISKIRRVKMDIINDNKDKEEEKVIQLNEKPINKLSLITKKRIKNLIIPILDRTKLNLNKCIITKVNQRHCVLLPNPIYKNEHYIITKKRKKIIPNEVVELKLPSEKNNYCYFTKERKKLINEHQKIPLKNISYIEKERKKEMLNEIKTIQNLFRAKKNRDNKDENLLFNNKDKNAFIPKIRYYNPDNDENCPKDKNNYIFEGYISKINKQHIFKLYPTEQCYISKQFKFLIKKENNYSFLSLLDFFIKKNIQEYVFPKLIPDKDIKESKRLETNYNLDTEKNVVEEDVDNPDNFTYPKYYKNLRRIFNFYKTKKREDSPVAQKLYDEMIPDIKDSKSLNDLVTKLNDNPENSNNLIDNQIQDVPKKNIDNNDLIEEIGEFVKYDKNLSNSAFIKNKLRENPEFKNNKNLFNIIKNVDDEYNNLINGKYCFKCGKEILKCKCDDVNYIFKETENAYENEKEEEEDDDLDFDLDNDEELDTKKINYFEYDTNKKKGLQMINKPRLEDYVTQPKKILQIFNKNQLNEINRKINANKGNLKNNSLNLFSNVSSNNKSLNSENNLNQRYSSYSNNNINNSMNSNNDDNLQNSNNKIINSSYTFKK